MSRITINSNLAAQSTQRRLGESTQRLQASFDRLSSGLRINRAKDDAAALSIASGLKLDNRVFLQGVRNLNDGIGYLNVADGAIGELKTVLIRLRELATQSSNGTLGSSQRQALDKEAQALVEEYNRIVEAAEFNDTRLFADGPSELDVQAGYGLDGRLTAVLGVSSTVVTGDGTFQAPTTYGTGDQPRGVAVGDFNGDGVLDLVNTDFNADTLSVHLGNGDGTFQARTTYGTGDGPVRVATADFNGDGKLDLVNTDGISDTLSVHLGNGDGTFQARTTYGTGLDPHQVAVGDFNGDGKLDLVNSDLNSTTLSVRLGNGDGTFQAGTTYATAGGPKGVGIADFNGDGKLDLVNINSFGENLSVHLGNGDGTFQAHTIYDTGFFPEFVAIADFNGDGKLDLVNSDRSSNTLSVHLGNGDGTFQARTTYGTGSSPRGVAVADFNGDGVLDLVNTDRNSDTLSVHLGNGDGTFQARTTYGTGSSPDDVAVGDFNGDGVLDLVNTDFNADTLSVHLANAVSTTTTLSIRPIAGIDIGSLLSARESQSLIDDYLDEVNAVAGAVGSAQSRFQAAHATLQATADNLRSAESRIMDADVAEESARLVKGRILQQAGAAVLAQANQQPQIALDLLS